MTVLVMLTAAQARSKAQNDIVIFNEVRDIELAILNATAAGNYETTVSTTTMTTGNEYFNVWQGSTTNRAKEKQMSTVMQYFTDLGYTIERKTNAATGNTLKWTIYW